MSPISLHKNSCWQYYDVMIHFCRTIVSIQAEIKNTIRKLHDIIIVITQPESDLFRKKLLNRCLYIFLCGNISFQSSRTYKAY